MPMREMREGDRRGEVSIALLPLVIVLGFIAFVIIMSIMFEAILWRACGGPAVHDP